MIPRSNTPAVNLANRKWLGELAREGVLLDLPSKEHLIRILARCKSHSPCGLVFDVAQHLGARRHNAMGAACVSELFFAVCSYTDDIQDGDASGYFESVPPAIHINLMAQLFCLVTVRLSDWVTAMGPPVDMSLVRAIFGAGASMLTGQRQEIIREPWDSGTYEEVARRIAGDQYSVFFRLAACAAGCAPERWTLLGRAYGTLLQLVVDQETGDERLFVIEEEERGRLENKLVDELMEASATLGTAADRITRALLQRCSKKG